MRRRQDLAHKENKKGHKIPVSCDNPQKKQLTYWRIYFEACNRFLNFPDFINLWFQVCSFGSVVHPPSFPYSRLKRWYVTIPPLDQWWTTIVNHWNQWLRDPKTIEKPLNPMVAPNHSIQWWWCLSKPLKFCNGSKTWS